MITIEDNIGPIQVRLITFDPKVQHHQVSVLQYQGSGEPYRTLETWEYHDTVAAQRQYDHLVSLLNTLGTIYHFRPNS